MKPFSYVRPESADEALRLLAEPGARALAGGTNLVDLMREEIEAPAVCVDVTGLGWDDITVEEGAFRVGAGCRNTALATHPDVRRALPFLAEAIVSGATGQIRNMATVGGNLLQRSRCAYFYDHATACNKRSPGSGCDAREGFNRGTAFLGTSTSCVSPHPSDLCVPLAALEATVHLRSADGSRDVAFADFHLLPGDTPDRETVLEPGELIESVTIPKLEPGYVTAYRKVRDRASYAFALVSVAAALKVENGRVTDARIALGGVGTKPWRARAAEDSLRGEPASVDAYRTAIRAELATAAPLPGVEFKVGLTEATVVATLRSLTEGGNR